MSSVFETESFGTCTCDCGRPECDLARRLRAACAKGVLEAIKAEYGSAHAFDLRPLETFPSREWVCLAFPRRHERPCPRCGYVPAAVPPWATFGAKFGLNKTVYRIVTVGSTNRHSPQQIHTEDFVTCEPVGDDPWSLPPAPALVSDVAAALDVLFKKMPRFRALELTRAVHLV